MYTLYNNQNNQTDIDRYIMFVQINAPCIHWIHCDTHESLEIVEIFSTNINNDNTLIQYKLKQTKGHIYTDKHKSINANI